MYYSKHTKPIVFTFSIILIFVCLFSSCSWFLPPPPPLPSPIQQWNSFVVEKERQEYQLMNVRDSQNWINRYHFRGSSDLPFLKTKRVKVIDRGSASIYIITVDYNNNPRVFKPFVPPKPPPSRKQEWENFVAQQKNQGYTPMSVQNSQSWIRNLSGTDGAGSVFDINITPQHVPFRGEFRIGPWTRGFFVSKDHEGNLIVFEKRQ